MKKRERNLEYYVPAEAAAELERNKHFNKAAKLWRAAADEALNPLNQQWATHRAERCEFLSC